MIGRDLVQRILVVNPQQRISLDGILAHKWFEKVLLPDEMKEIYEFNVKTGNILFGEEDHISTIPVTTLHASRLTMGSCSIGSFSPRFVTSKTAFGASSRYSPNLHSFYKYMTKDELEAETDHTLNSPTMTLKNGFFSRGLSISSVAKRRPTIKKTTVEIFDLKQYSPQTLNISPSIQSVEPQSAHLKLQRIAKGSGGQIDSSSLSMEDEEGSGVMEKYENLPNTPFFFDQLCRSSHFKKQSPKSQHMTRKNINLMSTTFSILGRENH